MHEVEDITGVELGSIVKCYANNGQQKGLISELQLAQLRLLSEP